MGQNKAVLDKIKRNLDILGISYTDSGTSIVVDSDWTISYEAADIQAPMAGVDGNSNPYLGIGVGNPGLIKVVDSANALAAMIDSAAKIRCLGMICGFANSIKLVDSGAVELIIEGHVDLVGMGQ